MIDENILIKLGLSNAESKIYIGLLALGEASLGNIIKQTGLRKSTIHESINRLCEKGLVSFIHKKYQKYYNASPPEQLLEVIAEKERSILDLQNKTKEFISEAKKAHLFKKPEAQAQVLVGIEGFKTMRNDIIKNSHGEHLLIGAISREDEVMPGFFKEWNKLRQKNKIKIRILHKESAREKAMTKKEFMGSHFETRFLPEEIESPAVINIYGERVVNVLWKENNPLCFLLINKEIADSYREYFEHLWKIAKR